MSYINNISENIFLNQLNWNILSCHDKALCIIAESLKKNASLYFILFKIMGRNYLKRHHDLGIGDATYYEYVGNLCGLHLERKYGKKEDFIDELKKIADSQMQCVLMINTKYQKGARLEGKKDHPHFMAYQGYEKDNFYFIDEDWSKQYWKTKDVENVVYCQRKINTDDLVLMGTNIDTCNIFIDDDVPAEKYFMYYQIIKTDDKPCELDKISNLFKEELAYLVEHNVELVNYTRRKMEVFSNNLADYRNKMVLNVRERLNEQEREEDEKAMQEQIVNARKDELFAIRTRFIYPCESEIIGAYSDFIYMIKRILILRTTSFAGKEKIIRQIQILIDSYEYVKLTIARSVILGQNDLVTEAWNRYIQLNKKSMAIYKALLREQWRIKSYE